MQISVYRKISKLKNFSVTPLLYIWIKILRKPLKLQKISKYWSLKKIRTNVEQKSAYTDNLGQNIWEEVKKSSKIGQHQKTLRSLILAILTRH